MHWLSCSAACGIFLDQGSNPVSPALAGGFLTTAPPGKSLTITFPWMTKSTNLDVRHCWIKICLQLPWYIHLEVTTEYFSRFQGPALLNPSPEPLYIISKWSEPFRPDANSQWSAPHCNQIIVSYHLLSLANKLASDSNLVSEGSLSENGQITQHSLSFFCLNFSTLLVDSQQHTFLELESLPPCHPSWLSPFSAGESDLFWAPAGWLL